MSTCIVCYEKYNASNHLCVKCEYCDFETCRSCCEQYVKGEGSVKCMNKNKNDKGEMICDKQWTRRHLAKYMTKQFMVSDYKKIREKIVRDSEFSKLPETMPFVESQIRGEHIRKEINNIDIQIRDLNRKKNNLHLELRNNDNHTGFKAVIEKSLFMRPCPSENCRGFLNSSWKCGLCETYTCKDCNVLKGKDTNEEHVCNPDDVASTTLLNKDSKACPSCSTGIFKIDGCDQMWCTICHTAFSWKTGRKEETIHNPHYYEYLRKTNGVVPRAPGDNPCGGDIPIRQNDMNQLITLMSQFWETLKATNHDNNTNNYDMNHIINEFSSIMRSKIHLNRVQAPPFNRNQAPNNRPLRIDYLRNKIDEPTFVVKVQRLEKVIEKNHEIYTVLTMFDSVMSDLLKRALKCIKNKNNNPANDVLEKMSTILQEVNAVIEYSNTLLGEIGSAYNTKQYKIQLLPNGSTAHTQVLV